MAFIGICVTIFVLIYYYFKTKFCYWKNRNVPFIEPQIPLGNLQRSGKKRLHSAHLMQKYYNELKGKGPFGGIYFFTKPVVLALDLEFIKNVLVKDFHHFQDRGVYYNERDDPISAHLFALDGQKWKILRSKLTPTFTSGKMKFMFPTIIEIANRFRDCLSDCVGNVSNDIELKDLLARFTTDVIGTVAFGIECNTLNNPDSEFRRMGKRAFQVSRIKNSFMTAFKGFARFFQMRTLNKDVSDFFMRIVSETVTYREENNVKRNDFMDLLIQLKNKGNIDDNPNEIAIGKLSLNEIAAQSFVFFLAGFETSSSALAYVLYELSLHLDIQQKGRDEVKFILNKYDGNLTYEAIMEMQYLGQIVYEALRKYPPAPLLSRNVSKDYRDPNLNVILNKDTLVIIPVYAIQHDPNYYPEPDKFDPSRFDPDKIKHNNPMQFLSFGEGSRNCIGIRFAFMELKICLSILLKTLRKYPPASNLIRMATKEYQVPDTLHVLPKNSLVMIPVFGVHYDPEFYPDPHKFDPDRFTIENIKNRNPCTYLPFGEGPRNCIGIRFGVMQTKIGLAMLLNRFEFKTCTRSIVPLVFQTKSIILETKGGLWLNVRNV